MPEQPVTITVHADQGDPWRAHLNPATLTRSIWAHRELLSQLIRRDIVGRYRGSYLGVLWALLTPLMLLCVFTLVFGGMYDNHWPGGGAGILDFAVNLFIGIILFTTFSEVTSSATSQITGNPNFVKKAVFPLELLGVSTLAASIVHSLLALGIEIIAVWIALGHVPIAAIALPLLYIPTALFTLGICWMLAGLGVFFRDLANAIGPVVQLLFFLTPIVYDRSLLARYPVLGQVLVMLNPFVVVVDSARGLMIRGQWCDWLAVGGVTLYSAAVCMAGYILFMRLRRYFADAM